MPLALLVASLALLTPADIELREGLAIRGVTRSGRTPIFTDGFLARWAEKGWKAPVLGDPIGEQKWEALKAGDDGTFGGNAFQGGYAYFEVEHREPEIMVLESSGWGMVYVDGAPRAGDPYGYGYVKLPVKLNKGKTGFLFASGRGRPRAKLVSPPAPAFMNLGDTTFPDLIEGQKGQVWGAVVVVNATEDWATGLHIRSKVGDGAVAEGNVAPIPPLSFRKVMFWIEAPGDLPAGEVPLTLTLTDDKRMLDFQKTTLRVRTAKQTRRVTFLSSIDDSLQYYAVNPAQTPGEGKALVLTLHGASVEAIGQADAYQGKEWCHIAAPTNRRPYGFDWEEIGRLDMLEVLHQAKTWLKTDPQQTYLAGHSMGGHGTWINGYLFPDQWAAIAPAAGWISFFTYAGGSRQTAGGPVAEAIRAASNSSDTLLLIANSLNYPVYIHHGDKDDNVPVTQARDMKAELDKIKHPNVTLNEVPGAGHWFGGESVDWPGIFDLFKSTKLKTSSEKNEIDFTAVNLAASSKAWWVQILQQAVPLAPSRVRFKRAPGRVVGTTENVEAIRFEGEAFAKGVNPRIVEIDEQTVSVPNVVDPGPPLTLRKVRGNWVSATDRMENQKRPEQTGPFKEVFKNHFFFVYGTRGSVEESASNLNLARYLSESFGYRGNGSVRIVSDAEFLRELEEEKGRVYIRKPDVPNVIVLGNSDTNGAWGALLKDSPIQVRRGEVRLGGQTFKGSDLGCVFVRPRPGDDVALVGAIASTGAAGQRILERVPYFTSGAHLPDWIVYSADMLSKGVEGVKAAGFFRNDWRLGMAGLVPTS